MEINGRPWGSFPLAVRSGMDFPALLADLFLNGPPQNFDSVNTNYQAGVRSRNLELDLMWIARFWQEDAVIPISRRPVEAKRSRRCAACSTPPISSTFSRSVTPGRDSPKSPKWSANSFRNFAGRLPTFRAVTCRIPLWSESSHERSHSPDRTQAAAQRGAVREICCDAGSASTEALLTCCAC